MDTIELVLKGGVVVLLVTGAVSDLRTRRIPNLLTLGGALFGLLVNAIARSGNGVISGLEGWGLGILLLLIPFLVGALGGGDVKLLAMTGAWLGPLYAYHTLVYGAIIGGAMSLVFLIVSGQFGAVFAPLFVGIRSRLAVLLVGYLPGTATAVLPHGSTVATVERPRLYLPFGPALAAGGLLALVLG